MSPNFPSLGVLQVTESWVVYSSNRKLGGGLGTRVNVIYTVQIVEENSRHLTKT